MILTNLNSLYNKKYTWLFINCFSALGEACDPESKSDICTNDKSECKNEKCQCVTDNTAEEGECKICNFIIH
jgi:hypothetical protein